MATATDSKNNAGYVVSNIYSMSTYYRISFNVIEILILRSTKKSLVMQILDIGKKMFADR